MHVVCFSCGKVFDSQAMACPRCRTCLGCGAANADGTKPCPSCGYAASQQERADLEQKCAASRPGNQEYGRKLDAAWQTDQMMGRVPWWAWLAFGALLGVPFFFLAELFRWLAGLPERWTMPLVMLLIMISVPLMRWLAWKGWLPWLRREQPAP
jgi:hypothetical protein